MNEIMFKILGVIISISLFSILFHCILFIWNLNILNNFFLKFGLTGLGISLGITFMMIFFNMFMYP